MPRTPTQPDILVQVPIMVSIPVPRADALNQKAAARFAAEILREYSGELELAGVPVSFKRIRK